MKQLAVKFLLAFALILSQSSCKEDPCAGIECNNAICVEGVCECDSGYTGVNCTEEITPTSVKIRNIRVIKIPEFNKDENGNDIFWDEVGGNAPDLFFEITISCDPPHKVSSAVIPEYPYNERIYLQFGPTIEEPEKEYIIELWDSDLIDVNEEFTDDLIFREKFTPYIRGTNFPEVVIFGNTDDPVILEIYLSYQF